jgi:hypothetical protein
MIDSNLPAYVGIATGILGTIAGISGCIMGYLSLRRANVVKPLDLRLELRRLVRQLGEDAMRTEEMLNVANEPRQIVSAATGLRDLMKWDEDFERDKRDFHEIKRLTPLLIENYNALEGVELESRLTAARRVADKLTELQFKYASASKPQGR